MRSTKILSNTTWILTGSAFNKVSTIFLMYVLTRYLGADGFGVFSFIFFYITFFSSIAEMGLTPVLIKHINSDAGNASGIQGHGLAIGLLFTMLAILLSWGTSLILGYDADIGYLILIASVGLLVSFRDITFRWILEVPFRAGLKMFYPVLLGILSELLGLISVVVAVKMQSSLKTIITVYVLANVPGFLALLLLSIRSIKPSFSIRADKAWMILKEALPIGSSNFLNMIYLTVHSLILFHFKGAQEVGYYALAFRLTTSLRIIPESMMHSLFPSLAGVHAGEDRRQVNVIIREANKYAAMISFPLVFGTIILAPAAAILIGGETFLPASRAMTILIFATFFAFFNTVLRFTFNAISLQRSNLWISLVLVTVSCVLSFILVPKYGFIGASYSLALSEGISLVLALAAANHYKLRVSFENAWKYLAASLVMSACIYNLSNIFLQIFAGIIIYLLTTILIGGIAKDQLRKYSIFKSIG